MRDDVQHHQAVLRSTTRGNLMTEHDLFAIVVRARIEKEFARIRAQTVGQAAVRDCLGRGAGATRGKDRPTREAARDFLHVLLGIAAIDAQRVQLHQFARVVFVDAASLLLLRWPLLLRVVAHPQQRQGTACRSWPLLRSELRIRAHALKIIKIEKHRRALGVGQ